jgi:hypothetical protein
MCFFPMSCLVILFCHVVRRSFSTPGPNILFITAVGLCRSSALPFLHRGLIRRLYHKCRQTAVSRGRDSPIGGSRPRQAAEPRNHDGKRRRTSSGADETPVQAWRCATSGSRSCESRRCVQALVGRRAPTPSWTNSNASVNHRRIATRGDGKRGGFGLHRLPGPACERTVGAGAIVLRRRVRVLAPGSPQPPLLSPRIRS